tara:strand:+ start:401 stop:523 length:123 start_codon:yes stop_codon:yes gene_type:complete
VKKRKKCSTPEEEETKKTETRVSVRRFRRFDEKTEDEDEE